MADPENPNMGKTMFRVKKEIVFLKKYLSKYQWELVCPIIKARIQESGKSTRASFTRYATEYIQEKPWGEIDVQVAFIIELSACVTYLENQIVDVKNGVNNRQKINENLLAAQILKECIERYLAYEFKGPKASIPFINERIRKICSLFSYGETLELYGLNYKEFGKITSSEGDTHSTVPHNIERQVRTLDFLNIWNAFAQKRGLVNSKREFMKNYFRRTFLINTVLYEEVIYILLHLYEKNKADYKSLRSFSRGYGMVQQMTNDIIDFVPVTWITEAAKRMPRKTYDFTGKFREDNFADIKNGLLTLPTIIFLEKEESNNSFLKRHLEESSTLAFERAELQEKLLEERGVLDSLKEGHDFIYYFGDFFRSGLSPQKLGYPGLIDLMNIVDGNKHYNLFFRKPQSSPLKKES